MRVSRVTDVKVVGEMPVRSPESRQHPFDSAAFLSHNRIRGMSENEIAGVVAILRQSVQNLLRGKDPGAEVPKAARFLCTFDVLAARLALKTGGLEALLADIEDTTRRLADLDAAGADGAGSAGSVAELRSLARALRRSAAILRLAPDQLPEQVLLRLGDEPGPLLRRLAEGAARYKTGPWLRPVTQASKSPYEIIKHLRGSGTSVCFEPGGRLLTLDGGRWLERLDLSGTEPFVPFRTGDGEPTALATDGVFAAIATRDGPIRILELASGPREPLVPDEPGATLAVAFLRPGLLVSGGTQGRVRSWDVATSRELGSFDLGDDLSVEAMLALGPDRLVLGTDPDPATRHTVQIWDPATGRRTATFAAHDWPVTALAVSADAELLIAAANDELSAWRLPDLSCAWRVGREHVTFHSLACLSGRVVAGDAVGTLRVFDLCDGSELRRLPTHSGLVPEIAVDEARRRLVTVSYDQSVRLWDAAAVEQDAAASGHQQEVRTLALTADGTGLLSGSKDGRVLHWDARSGAFEGEIGAHEHWVSEIVALPADRALSVGWDGALRIWDLSCRRSISVIASGDPHLACVACTDDGKRAATASISGTIRVWDIAGKEQLAMFTPPEETDVAAVKADGGRVLWLTETGWLWSWRPGSDPEGIELPVQGRVTACELGYPDDGLVVGLSTGLLYRIRADGTAETFGEGDCAPSAITRDGSGELLLAAFGLPRVASDDTARLWMGRERGASVDLVGDSPWTAALMSRDGEFVYLGDEAGGVHVVRPVLPGADLTRPGPGPAGRSSDALPEN